MNVVVRAGEGSNIWDLSEFHLLYCLPSSFCRFIFVMPPVEAPPPSLHACHPPPWLAPRQAAFQEQLACELWPRARPLHRIVCNMRTQFPDLRLIQYDCGEFICQRGSLDLFSVLIARLYIRSLWVLLNSFLDYAYG